MSKGLNNTQGQIQEKALERIQLPRTLLERVVASITSAVNVAAIYIFGSYARGSQHENSDLDIYVVTPDAEEDRHNAVVRIGVGLFGLGIPRDILAAGQREFDDKANVPGSVESDVVREGVLLYG